MAISRKNLFAMKTLDGFVMKFVIRYVLGFREVEMAFHSRYLSSITIHMNLHIVVC